ncbi:MAG: hypothetical protein IJC50_03440 [Clostridia bacterium]|nr:hypothetical protein [Clostridia bacterium]
MKNNIFVKIFCTLLIVIVAAFSLSVLSKEPEMITVNRGGDSDVTTTEKFKVATELIGTDTNTESKSEPKEEPETVTVTDTESESETEAIEIITETESETEAVTEPGPETEYVTETDAVVYTEADVTEIVTEEVTYESEYHDIVSDIVYTTETGTKYHLSGCSYLRSSANEITLEEAEGQGYTPCSRCFK